MSSRIQWCILSSHQSWELQVYPYVSCVHCLIVVELWLLLSPHWFLGQLSVGTGCYYREGASVQGPILWNRICFSAEFTPWLCSLWGCSKVIIWNGMQLSTECTGYGVFREVQGQPSSVFCLGLLIGAIEQSADGCYSCCAWRYPREVNQGQLLLVSGLWPVTQSRGMG